MEPETPAINAIEEIQTILKRFFPEIKADGDIGKKTKAYIDKLDAMGDSESVANTADSEMRPNTVKATSFADLADVDAFNRCKKQGGSDDYCFSKGDNGIGAWGQLTAQNILPMVALPREVWRNAGKKGGDGVLVEYNGHVVRAVLGDTMPSLSNIHNGAGIDLNPACCKALGLTPPVEADGVTWSWI